MSDPSSAQATANPSLASSSDGEAPSTEPAPGVVGERAIPSVNRVRSLQSRVSAALAIAVFGALAVGLIAWYYTQALSRGDKAEETAKRAMSERAKAEMTVPPLGPIRRPQVVPANITPSEERPERLGEYVFGPPPEMPASVPVLPASAAPAPPSVAAPRKETFPARERKLGGQVFLTSGASGTSRPGSSDPQSGGTSQGQVDGSMSSNVGELANLLESSVLPVAVAHQLPARRLLIPKGTNIDCTLETAIDTSVAGLTTCITATDTFGADGSVVLLERGTKLTGETKGQVQPGSARVFVVWTEARTPTGVIAPLNSPGTDELGRSGLPGQVDRHFFDRFGAAILISVVDGVVQAAAQSGTDGAIVINPSRSSQVLTEIPRDTLNIRPTVLKPQGDRIQILAARDLDFRSIYALRVSR